MKIAALIFVAFLHSSLSSAQLKWRNVDSLYQPLPTSVHVYFTDDSPDTSAFRAFYLVADLKDRSLEFLADTTRDRRLTPSAFYEKNDRPLVVVNTTFFSFETNRNLNVVIKNGKLVSYNIHTIPGRGKDTFTFRHPFTSAIGIRKDRTADIAWLYTDSSSSHPFASQKAIAPLKDSSSRISRRSALNYLHEGIGYRSAVMHSKWKMKTAVGGGPVLVQDGEILISNNEELKFAGKAINDKHPRTGMGFTADGKLVILVIEGRNKNAAGATLKQEAQIFKDLGCQEALNLDGGGSSCLLVNGKPTIQNSDGKQRPVPAVFIIRNR